MKKPQIIAVAVVVLLIVIAAGAWFAFFKPHATTTPTNGRYGMASTTPRGFGGMRGGFVTGSIEVLNGNGFTLTLADSSTKNVTLTATTTIQNYASASSAPTTITPDQLSVGEKVSVIGEPNDDGSIEARLVRTGTFPTMPSGGRSATSTRQRPQAQ